MPLPVICNHCGVELEADMLVCPLCGNPVNSLAMANPEKRKTALVESGRSMNQPQRKITWEVVTVVLVCIIIATSTINLIINKNITWSEYPIGVCLLIFSYVSVFTFWSQSRGIQVIVSMLAAAAALFLLDWLTTGLNWAFSLAIPLLVAVNMVILGLLQVIRWSRQKGVNLIAYGFLAAALLCVCTEAILDLYLKQSFRLWWSVIVSICVLPVSVVLLLMHFRYKRGRDLQKTFHL